MTRDVLDFAEEAKEVFNRDNKKVTYRNDSHIALRTGMFEDCILVFEATEVGFFEQWCNRKIKGDKE